MRNTRYWEHVGADGREMEAQHAGLQISSVGLLLYDSPWPMPTWPHTPAHTHQPTSHWTESGASRTSVSSCLNVWSSVWNLRKVGGCRADSSMLQAAPVLIVCHDAVEHWPGTRQELAISPGNRRNGKRHWHCRIESRLGPTQHWNFQQG